MGRQTIGRNPHGVRYKALAFGDLEVGLKVVVIRGGIHEHATIASLPYRRKHDSISRDPRMIGKPGQVIKRTSWFIRLKDVSTPAEELSLPAWYNDMQADYKKKPTEEFLSEMGLCPDRDGRWSLTYTVRKTDYDPRGLHK